MTRWTNLRQRGSISEAKASNFSCFRTLGILDSFLLLILDFKKRKKKHHFVVICTLLRRLISIYNSQVYDGVSEGEAPSADKVMQSFSSWYGQDEREEVFGEDSEYDENRKVSNCFNVKVENNDLLQRLERK